MKPKIPIRTDPIKYMRRITALGGPASLPGSCAWNVLGVEMSIQAWCTQRPLHSHRIDPHEARKIPVFGFDALLAICPDARLCADARRLRDAGRPGIGYLRSRA